MKKLLLSVLMLAVSSVSFAQSNYNKVYASLALGSFSIKDEATAVGTTVSGKESVGLAGVNAGYAYGISLKKGIPMFLEVGGELTYKGGSKSNVKFNFLDLSIPVNFVYRFPVSNKFAIAPYAGLNFKFNILGNFKSSGSDAVSFFDKDKVGNSTANRFQIGMNLGVNFIVNKRFSFGYRFQPNFMKYYSAEGTTSIYYTSVKVKETTNIISHFITVGYIF